MTEWAHWFDHINYKKNKDFLFVLSVNISETSGQSSGADMLVIWVVFFSPIAALFGNYSKKEELVMHFMTLQVLHFLCALHNLDI